MPQTKTARLGYAGIPILGYVSGFGMGFGAAGALYRKQEGFNPYRYELDAQTYFSLGGFQSHRLRFDSIDVGGLPLRLRPVVGFIANLSQSFCGLGMNANCDSPHQDFPNFYLHRYLEGYAGLEGRWRLQPLPHKIEFIASWRGSYYRIGSLSDSGPYPDSLYGNTFGYHASDGDGFASVLEVGLMVDNRDFEPDPKQGYWVEATVREASRYWGSSWNYVGGNLSFRGYWPLMPNKRLTLAAQVLLDAMLGESPLQEIVRAGGSGRYFNTFGGQEIGRGLREQYFPGRLKAYKQLELRYEFVDFSLWDWKFNLSATSFADFGVVAWSIHTLNQEPFKPAIGFGGGLRLLWDRAVMLRFDVGMSPIENYAPKFYLVIGNAF
ncbi:MAG: BamA/TamA family outer membrane protein [Myxococcaceae bacterium]|nr:BamA/TamA family outer membrane protein [Myxococcaceae bacterium]